MTVLQNIKFGIERTKVDHKHELLDKLIRRLYLTGLEKKYPHQLSGGEARRVAIARSLAPLPKRILMDEPLVNLNHELKDSVLEFILQITSDIGASLIYVTHDRKEAPMISSNVIELDKGKIISSEY